VHHHLHADLKHNFPMEYECHVNVQ
jgi:hypothetical protein